MALTILSLSFVVFLLLGVPVAIAGALIVLFSIEHIVALMHGTEVEPAWH